jgi:predicted PurR-regulated permease PerM
MQFNSTQKTIAAWSALAVIFLLMLWQLAPVLAPFVVAFVLAYALTPVLERLDALTRARLPRVLLVLVVECVFLLLLTGTALLLIPIVAKEIPLIRAQLPSLLAHGSDMLQPLLTQWGVPVVLDSESIQAAVRQYLNANSEQSMVSLVSSVRLGGSVALALVSNAVLIPVVLFYLLHDWPRLIAMLRDLTPPHMRAATDHFVRDADAVLGQYLRGQLLVMALLAVYYSLGLALFRLDLAVPIGVFTGLAVFVPYLGYGLGLVLATVAGLLEFTAGSGVGYTFVMVAVVFGVGQVLEGFFLTPKLVGERIGLHPLAVIFALLAFGQLFGLVGVLVALPVSAVLLVGIRRVRVLYLSSHLYQG